MYKRIDNLRFWCNKILPLVYDDSLSYYETLCKISEKLNEVINDVNELPQYIADLVSDEKLKEILSTLLNNLQEQIASANEGESKTATEDRTVGELVWLNGELYKITHNMIAGDQYVVNSNCEKITIEQSLNSVLDAVKAETESRENADNEIKNLINEETLARENADNEIKNLINEETSTRENADNLLYEKIDNISSELAKSVKDYGASGSDESTYANVVANNSQIVVDNIIDLAVGNGVIIERAGSGCELRAPVTLSVSAQGTTGDTVYTYSIAKIDVRGGMTNSISNSISNGNAELSADNYNIITFDTDANAYAYAVYRNNKLISILSGGLIVGTFYDRGAVEITPPFNISATPPTVPIARYLKTSVVSILDNVITVKDKPSSTNNGLKLYHDDTDAINTALAENSRVYLPEGTYNITHTSPRGISVSGYVGCLIIPKNTEMFGVKGSSIISSKMSYMHGAMVFNYENVYGGNNDHNISIHDLTFNGNMKELTLYTSSNAINFRYGSCIFMAKNGTQHPSTINISNCEFKNAIAGCVIASCDNIYVGNCYINHTMADGVLIADSCQGGYITNNQISDTGDDGIGLSSGEGEGNINITVISNRISRSGSRGINVQGGGHKIIANSVIYTAWHGIDVNNNDGAKSCYNISVTNNNCFRVGEYRGGINGWVNYSSYDVALRDYADTSIYILNGVSVVGNQLQDVNSIKLECNNASKGITNVSIYANNFISGGTITRTDVGYPANNINTSNNEYTGSITMSLTAVTPSNIVVNFPTMPEIPNVSATVDTLVASYTNIKVRNVTRSSFVIDAICGMTTDITINWYASC